MIEIRGYGNYYYDGEKFYSKDRIIPRDGSKGSFRLLGKEIKVTKDKVSGYHKLILKDDNGKRRNLLLHRLIYAVHNDLEYSFEGVCLHADNNKENNTITNLYLGDPNKGVSDKTLSEGLLRAYKNKTIFQFLENKEYREIR